MSRAVIRPHQTRHDQNVNPLLFQMRPQVAIDGRQCQRERERDRERDRGGGREREGERESNMGSDSSLCDRVD